MRFTEVFAGVHDHGMTLSYHHKDPDGHAGLQVVDNFGDWAASS
jgi:hypothetical protein